MGSITPTEQLRYRGQIPGLDTLRGIAVLLVVVCHAIPDFNLWHGFWRPVFYTLAFGSTGVHLFFVLSGFLITGILLDSSSREQYFRPFYIRRALRILPAYLLLVAGLKVAGLVSWRYVAACLLYITNMPVLLGAAPEYSVLWSLAVEEQFYLVWPVAIRYVRRHVGLVIGVACVMSPILRALSAWRGADPYWKTWDNADYLLYGALISLSLRNGRLNVRNIGWISNTLIAVGAAGSAALMLAHDSSALTSPALAAAGRIPFALFYAGFVLRAVRHNTGVVKQPFLAFLGFISYGLYLIHPLAYQAYDGLTAGTWLADYNSNPAAVFIRMAASSAGAILIAWISRTLFEERFLALKDRLTSASPVSAVRE